MKLHIIFGQRIESHPGQYAPEALEIMDEGGMEENPQWFEEKIEGYRKSGDFSSVREVIVVIPLQVVDDILNKKPIVVGEIKE